MTAAKQVALVSVEDYLAGELIAETKHEYTGGYIYAMAGARVVHNLIAGNFFGILFAKLRGKPCRPFNPDMKVRVRYESHTRFYYPDGMVVCESNAANDSYQDRPAIIAEVLSRDTRRIDEGEKREAYLSIPTLSAYLLIDSTSANVVVHHRTPEGFIARQYDGLQSTIPLEAIGATLTLAELYERVDFAAAQGDDADPEDEFR